MIESQIEENDTIITSPGNTPIALGFVNGRLCALDDTGLHPVTLKESLAIYRDMQANASCTCTLTESDAGALLRWLDMLTAVIR